jgi:hypothetical protein
MRTLFGLVVTAALALPTSGCIVVPGRYYSPARPRAVYSTPNCPPAHHWDGRVCRHNGNRNGNGRNKQVHGAVPVN